jgi:FdrA protein
VGVGKATGCDMSVVFNQVRTGVFLDSVVLMRISRELADLEGIEEAALMIGTPSNLAILERAGLLSELGRQAGGGDLVLAVRARDAATAEIAATEAERALERPSRTGSQAETWQPRTLRSACSVMTDANFALVSVPGDFAAAEARKALRLGLHVMIFSDNVPLEEEVALKREATEAGLLVMGPDCGTVIIGGVPLAFANQVSRGDIGLIGASGTGIQEVSSLITRLGGGVSHALGVGGRDLSDAVGGSSMLAALKLLNNDPGTRHVVLISKPPSTAVAKSILTEVAASDKTFSICFIGAAPLSLPSNATLLRTLKAAAEHAVGTSINAVAKEWGEGSVLPGAGRSRIVGLFCGGTLAAEAQVVFIDEAVSVASNAPIPGVSQLVAASHHVLVDLGDDSYTRGRPHPMIDPTVREGELVRALGDPTVAVVLLDVVIGHGAHVNPASAIARVLCKASPERPVVVASVTGTKRDPQDRDAQASILRGAGVLMAPSNADAARLALACLSLID